MNDQDKAKEQLINELEEIRQKVSELEASLVTLKQPEKARQEAEAISKPENAPRQSGAPYKSLYSMMRLMCDTVPDLIWAKDMDGKFLFVNRAMCENLLNAMDTEEPIGKTDMFFADRARGAHPENPEWHTFGEICVNSDQLVKSTGRPERFDEFGNVKGEFLRLDVYKAPFWNGQGEMIGTVGCGRIVTEEKRLQEALRRKSDEQSLLLDNIGTQIWFLTSSDTYGGVNKAHAEFLGMPPEKLENKSLYEILTKEEADVWVAGNIDVFETKKPVHTEKWVKNGKGQRRLLAITKTPKLDDTGNVEFVIGSAEDITDRKKAEEALNEAARRWETTFDSVSDAMWLLDSDMVVVCANRSTKSIFELEADQIVGRHCWEVVHGTSEPIAACPVALAAKSLRRETAHLRSGERWLEVTADPILDDVGRHIGTVHLARDITERKQAEEERESLRTQLLQSQKMEAIGTLAGGIAHDFNNLLTVVLGFSELLLAEKSQDDREYADLQKIFHAAKSGAELVQRLLMFSRKSESKPVPMNLNKQIVQVEKLLRRTIPRMIDIRLDLSSDLPEINADPSQIEQVLMNLAVNARDAMPEGGKLTVRTDIVTLEEEYCRLHVEAEPGDYVLLEVSDTGHGMDKETVEHIFEPFFTTKEMGGGTGLGLAMVYGIVQQHNGHITVSSEVGKGTSFRVYLPAIQGEVETDSETSGEMPAFGTETVLLVDDEEFVRELGARILTKHGYTVLQAENGREALDLFTKERARISLVILDLIMPEMGGTECLKELLKIDPKVTVLVASGYSADASVKETIQMGAKGFVTKPFRVKELLRDVRQVLDEV